MKLLKDWMIVEEVNTRGTPNIVVPDGVKEKDKEALVFRIIDCGPGYHDDNGTFVNPAESITIGDEVLLEVPQAAKISVYGKKMCMCRFRDVAAILEPHDRSR